MPTYKGDVQFKAGSFGWSETWYLNAANGSAALTALGGYVSRRREFLSKESTIERYKVSDLAILGDSFANDTPVDPFPSNATADTDYPAVGWLCSFRTTDGRRRSLVLRGIKDVFSGMGEASTNRPAVQKIFDRLMTGILNNGLGMLVLDRSGANPQKPVTNMTSAAGRWIVACVGHGFALQQNVIIRRIRPAQGYTGKYTVVAKTDDTFDVYKPVTPTRAQAANFAKAYAVKNLLTFSAIDSGNLQKVITRRTGRPIGQRPGKSTGLKF